LTGPGPRTWPPRLPAELGPYAQRPAHRLPVDAGTIEQLRRALGRAIEPTYEAFLLEYGGVAFSELVEFRLPAGDPWGKRGTLLELFGRFGDGRSDLFTELAAAAPALGPSWLPIGRDPGGNLLVLSTGQCGVWFWDHEARPTGGAMAPEDLVVTESGERLHQLAPSFAAFVAGLSGRSWDSATQPSRTDHPLDASGP